MTIVVCVRVNDGIVLAADSATSFTNTSTGEVIKVYNHADKIFNLVKGLPIGAMTYGNGAIGSSSISTISKDLRRLFDDPLLVNTYIDRHDYSIKGVAEKARDHFFALYQSANPIPIPDYFMGYRVCGYSSDGDLPEAREVGINGPTAFGPNQLYNHANPEDFGVRWAGDPRLLIG